MHRRTTTHDCIFPTNVIPDYITNNALNEPGSVLLLPIDARVEAAQLVSKTLSAKPAIQSGRSPAVIAAASVYHVCRRDGYKRTQQAVVDAADVNVKALRDIYQQQTAIDDLPLDES